MNSLRIPYGTLINMAALIVGGMIGLILKDTFPDNIQTIIFQAIGLSVLLIGLKMSLHLPEGYVLILVGSMVVGGIIGELISLDVIFNNLGDNLKLAIGVADHTFTEGFITSFLLCCVGSLAIIGSIEEGLNGKRDLLLVKSLLDLFTGVILAMSFGVGVIFAALPMLIFQGGITLLAGSAQKFFSDNIVKMISSVGGLLLIGTAINLLKIGEINLSNLLPALVIVVIGTFSYDRYKGKSLIKI